MGCDVSKDLMFVGFRWFFVVGHDFFFIDHVHRSWCLVGVDLKWYFVGPGMFIGPCVF